MWPWLLVTKIKYHPFSLAAGVGWMLLSSNKQETTWPGKSGVLTWRRSLWALGRSLNVLTPCSLSVSKLVSRPELAEEGLEVLQQP